MIEDLKFWLKKKETEKENLRSQLISKKEDFKSKSVMLKYQLIFIKVEIYLNNFANLFELREIRALRTAFSQIRRSNWARKQMDRVVVESIALDLRLRLAGLDRVCRKQSRRQLILAMHCLKK